MLSLSLMLVGALMQQAPASKGHVLIITGVSGEPQYEKDFYAAGKALAEGVRTKYGVPDSMVIYLAENPERDGKLIQGKSTKEEITRAFAKIKARAVPNDIVFVVLIGHGSSQGTELSYFNLPGNDMTAADFAALVAPLSKQHVVFVNAASASGDFIGGLKGPNRVVITSTMSPMERNYSQFAKHFSAAINGTAADANKDGRVSMLEGYEFSRRKIEQEYTAGGYLQSEHPRIDDNGDGQGSEVAERQGADGRLAARIFVSGIVPEDPKLTPLLDEYAALRNQLEALVNRKSAVGATYGRDLEQVLFDMVIVSLKIRQAGAGGKP